MSITPHAAHTRCHDLMSLQFEYDTHEYDNMITYFPPAATALQPKNTHVSTFIC